MQRILSSRASEASAFSDDTGVAAEVTRRRVRNSEAPILPPGFGVRQPYAAFVVSVRADCSAHWSHTARFWSWILLTSAATSAGLNKLDGV
jgi:hypothetical protein